MEPLARASDIQLHFDDDADKPAIILGDRDELVQVLSNLVHNAIKYGHGGGNVWLVRVRDDGPGIPAGHLPRLTERFYRANGNGGEKGGTGLGLAIVKHVVGRHRGDLRIASELGLGSTFTIAFDEAPPVYHGTLESVNVTE
jgi:two-component system phosphate regulon sensor histidine kinase PhoR